MISYTAFLVQGYTIYSNLLYQIILMVPRLCGSHPVTLLLTSLELSNNYTHMPQL